MQPKIKRTYLPKIRLVLWICFWIVLTLGIIKVIFWGINFEKKSGLSPGVIFSLIFDGGKNLQSTDGVTNILILGIAGGDHAGPDLTDTNLVLSLNHDKNTLGMISIPRDIWSDLLKDKINSAYHYGELKEKGGGLILAKATIEDIIGLPIHYVLVENFSGFQELIDLVGGVTVNAAKGFIDTQYPIAGRENDLCNGDPAFSCRYETITFNSGLQLMDGVTALKYVRSRHAEGVEGSDFARNVRQQEVLVALKQKIMNPFSWFRLNTAKNLITIFQKTVITDMTIGELLTVVKLSSGIPGGQIKHISFENMLTSPPVYLYGGRFVLIPIDNLNAIQNYISGQLK